MPTPRNKLGRSRVWHRLNVPLISAVATTLLCVALWGLHQRGTITVPGLDALELLSSDVRFRLRGPRRPVGDSIVVVGVDDQTRHEFPQVFNSRAGWAGLVRQVASHNPRAIGIDLLFSAPEINLSATVVAQVKGARAALAAAPQPGEPSRQALAALDAVIAETKGDDELADAITAARTVHLGVVFQVSDRSLPARQPRPGLQGARLAEIVSVRDAGASPFAADSVSLSLPMFTRGAVGAGALNVAKDPDGKVRRAYAVIEYRGYYYQTLAVSMALASQQPHSAAGYMVGDHRLDVGQRSVAVSDRAEAYLSHLGPNKSFPRVSAADVLADRVPANALTDKLVFIGFTDVMRDKLTTPFADSLDGVEIHATLTHNILHDELMRPASPWLTLMAILLCGFLLAAAQLRFVRQWHAWMPGACLAVIVVAYLVVSQVAFARGVVMQVVAPTAASLLVALASISTALATEGREKARMRAAFAQYVSDALVDRIVRDPGQAKLGGHRRELTVMFTDIRGFSRFSETLEPEVLSAYLNQYLTPMTELVRAHSGMLDKYIGDAIMAVYGAPLPLEQHAEEACSTALAMLEALGPLNEMWQQSGLPEIQIGVGINSGPMSIGNMGSEARFDYTVIGDAVNLCARLEPLTKQYQVDILVGEATAALAGASYLFRELDHVRVVGRDAPAQVLELIGPRSVADEWSQDLELFETALADYRGQRWDEADDKFNQVLTRRPDDGPSRVMRARIADLRRQTLPEDWDGVFSQHSK